MQLRLSVQRRTKPVEPNRRLLPFSPPRYQISARAALMSGVFTRRRWAKSCHGHRGKDPGHPHRAALETDSGKAWGGGGGSETVCAPVNAPVPSPPNPSPRVPGNEVEQRETTLSGVFTGAFGHHRRGLLAAKIPDIHIELRSKRIPGRRGEGFCQVPKCLGTHCRLPQFTKSNFASEVRCRNN
jgi:hypothetical protein